MSRTTERLESLLRGRNKTRAIERPKLHNIGFPYNHKSSFRGLSNSALPRILKARFAGQVSHALQRISSSTSWVSKTSQKPASLVSQFRATVRLKLHFAVFHNVAKARFVAFQISRY